MQPLATKTKCKTLLEFNAIKDSHNITSLNLEELRERAGRVQVSHANNCLITVLNCLDYECISSEYFDIMKDVAGNSFVTDVLDGFVWDTATLPVDVLAAINTLKLDRKRRNSEILPCIMCMDEDEHFYISFYDKDERAMRKFINLHLHDNERSHEVLEYDPVLDYKENILCFGQTEQDTQETDEQIKSVWVYNTF